MACQKLTPLTRIYQDHHHPPHHHNMAPFGSSPPHQDLHPLHTSFNDRNSFLGYPPTSITATDLSSIRCLFQGVVVRVNKQKATTSAATTTTMEPALLLKAASNNALCEEPDSMENSDSSLSSCFMSSNSDDEDDVSSSSTSPFSEPNAAASPPQEGPLDNLASLSAALPIKRGLSRYFSGKSQSFSSLARVSSVADLAKPENSFVKRRRTAAGGDSLLKHHSYPPRCASSAGISKRHVNNRYKSLRSFPLHEEGALDGQVKPKPLPVKCFSVPEFQKTGF